MKKIYILAEDKLVCCFIINPEENCKQHKFVPGDILL